MGAVVSFPPCSVDEAWEAYRAHAAQEIDNPKLGLNRQHMEQRIRLHRRWFNIFVEGDRA